MIKNIINKLKYKIKLIQANRRYVHNKQLRLQDARLSPVYAIEYILQMMGKKYIDLLIGVDYDKLITTTDITFLYITEAFQLDSRESPLRKKILEEIKRKNNNCNLKIKPIGDHIDNDKQYELATDSCCKWLIDQVWRTAIIRNYSKVPSKQRDIASEFLYILVERISG